MRSVLESLLSVVYWFPFYYTFKFVFLLWLSLPVTRYGLSDSSACLRCANYVFSGADVVFRSFLQPMFGRYFGASTAPGLRAQADKTE